MQKSINFLCAAIIIFSNNVFAFAIDSENTGNTPILNHPHASAVDSEDNDLSDKLVVCPLVTRKEKDLLSARDAICETERTEPNLRLDKEKNPGSHEMEQGDILIKSDTDSTGVRSSTHSIPRIELNPNPALVVFSDPNREEQLFYGMVSLTIRW